MDEGRIVAWRKREGDRVEKGEILFEVETDKATMEIEAPSAGIVRRVLVAENVMVPVTTLVALISEAADEPLPDLAEVAPSVAQAIPSVAPAAAPAASPADAGARVRSSPAARRRAQELGVDLTTVRGTGPGGRVGIEDVEAAASAPTPTAATGGERREPLSRMRRAVADAMTRSVREAPQFSISRDVDMSGANARRRAAGVSYTDVIVLAAAQALRAHERLRARYEGDGLVISDRVDVGIAVALDQGLIVPVLRGADAKPLRTIRDEREALEAAVASGHARADAFGGAAITVSNLGTFGIDRFTAIVNPPEASILAVGRVADRVVAVDGAPAVRPMVSLTLTVDHRVADGADAARYLAAVAEALEAV